MDANIWKAAAGFGFILALAFALLWLRGGAAGGAGSGAPERPLDPAPAPAPAPKIPDEAGTAAGVARLLGHADPKVRKEAVELLAALDPKLAAERLPELLKREADPGAQLAALHAAGLAKAGGAYEAVFGLLDSEEPSVRRKAAVTLAQLAAGLPEEQRVRAAERIALGLQNEQKKLRAPLQAADAGALLPYLGALGETGTPAAAPALLGCLRSAAVPLVRRMAADALDKVARKEHQAALEAAWRAEAEPLVRQALEKILARPPFNHRIKEGAKVLAPEAKE
ncbi:MAG: HEAT repeat domain-containing protein [Planctomycetota bacterium]|nr:HEAT repeat domain-containing protein [Planctomycetota bacterium]